MGLREDILAIVHSRYWTSIFRKVLRSKSVNRGWISACDIEIDQLTRADMLSERDKTGSDAELREATLIVLAIVVRRSSAD